MRRRFVRSFIPLIGLLLISGCYGPGYSSKQAALLAALPRGRGVDPQREMRGAIGAGTHAFTVRGADGTIYQGVSHSLGDMYATYLFISREDEFWKICEPLPGMMFINAVPVGDVASLPESAGRAHRALAAVDLSGDALRASLAREANDPIGEIPLVVVVPLMLPYLPILPFVAGSMKKEDRRLAAEEAQFDGRLVVLGATPQDVDRAFKAGPRRVGGGPEAQWQLYGPVIDDRLHAPQVVVWFEAGHATAVFTGLYASRRPGPLAKANSAADAR